MLAGFTLNGLVKIENWYLNETQPPNGPKIYTKSFIEECIRKAKRREPNYYPETDGYLYQALDHFPIAGKTCVVMGSQNPWYEAICLAFGASQVTTIEYWHTISEHPQVKVLTPEQYAKDSTERFDVGFSISSFEHDGLGRYGDPVNPDADLAAMKQMKSILKPNGILFLAVPMAVDKTVWNAHRIYGRHRLPLLLAGWKVRATAGVSDQLLAVDTGAQATYQPLLVLENV